MPAPPAALLLDDGELDDVAALLESLGVTFTRLRGGAIPARTALPACLAVATPKRVGALVRPGSAKRPLRIVVTLEDSPALRTRLRRVGVDYLVRRPVHPDALRLLLQRCLYVGEERRRAPRVPTSLAVSFHSGAALRRATLVDVSRSGCLLVSQWPLEVGASLRVYLAAAGDATAMSIAGRVTRSGPIDADATAHETALRFGDVDGEALRALDLLLASPAIPVDLRLVDAVGAAEPRSSDQRRSPRHAFERPVTADMERGSRVLLGRDISRGGMGAEALPGVEVGDRLRLAIYGESEREPLLVWATVARRDDVQMALVFDPQSDTAAAALERLIAALPAVECLRDGEAAAMGSVVSEVLVA